MAPGTLARLTTGLLGRAINLRFHRDPLSGPRRPLATRGPAGLVPSSICNRNRSSSLRLMAEIGRTYSPAPCRTKGSIRMGGIDRWLVISGAPVVWTTERSHAQEEVRLDAVDGTQRLLLRFGSSPPPSDARAGNISVHRSAAKATARPAVNDGLRRGTNALAAAPRRMSAAYASLLLFLLNAFAPFNVVTANNSKDLRVDGGLNDASAVVGKLFLYTIQPSAFAGHVRNYQISDAADGPLPDWLYWDELRAQLFGVPTQADVGHVYVQVTAIGALNRTHTQTATDVFDIHVREETATALCARRPAVSIGLLLDANATEMTAYERVGLMERAAKQLHVSADDLRLYSAEYERDARQRELLMAGSGNVPVAAHPDAGAILIWPIACGRTIDAEATKRVEELEKEAESGAIASKLGYGVTSWEVSSGKLTSRKLRRQLGRGITPSLGLYYSTESPIAMTEVDVIETTTPAAPTTQPPTTTTTTALPETTEETTTTEEEEDEEEEEVVETEETTSPMTTTTQKRTTRQSTWREVPMTTAAPRRPNDKKPVAISSLDAFTCKRGVVCRMNIPEATFTDEEDGDTRRLKLSLHPIDETTTDWLSLNGTQIMGLSLESGTFNYRLNARDSSDQLASIAFAVEVPPADEDEKFNHYYRVVINKSRQELLAEPAGLVELVGKLATALGDSDSSHITVRAVKDGSTVIEWSNNTLPKDVCAEASIRAIERVMVSKSGKIRKIFERHMGFHHPVTSVDTELIGNCDPLDNEVTPDDDDSTTESPDRKEKGVVSNQLDDLFLSTVLPVAIIIVLLVVAIVVACCLYRRNRSYKLAASKEAKSDYVSKGMPVVFPEEVGGRDDMATVTTPMLVKEERPPLVPPPFDATADVKRRSPSAPAEQRGVSVASATTEHENPLYKPPPPIELSSTRSPRPKHTLPHQREPPPYVPP
uniref:Dystroglycan 1 n=1 Tax=Plectus sambesii TaxID=2011161 RepID=A0A914W0Z4_9BILA